MFVCDDRPLVRGRICPHAEDLWIRELLLNVIYQFWYLGSLAIASDGGTISAPWTLPGHPLFQLWITLPELHTLSELDAIRFLRRSVKDSHKERKLINGSDNLMSVHTSFLWLVFLCIWQQDV